MKTSIGSYDDDKRSVPVTFTEGDIVHKRDVNACHDDSGKYDVKATKARVAEVALGVAAKIAAGAIIKPVEQEFPG